MLNISGPLGYRSRNSSRLQTSCAWARQMGQKYSLTCWLCCFMYLSERYPKNWNQSMQLYNPQKPIRANRRFAKARKARCNDVMTVEFWKTCWHHLFFRSVSSWRFEGLTELRTVEMHSQSKRNGHSSRGKCSQHLRFCVLESHPSDARCDSKAVGFVCEARSLDRNYAKNQGVSWSSWSLFVMPEIHLLSRLEEHSARHHAFSQDEQSTATTLPWLETCGCGHQRYQASPQLGSKSVSS